MKRLTIYDIRFSPEIEVEFSPSVDIDQILNEEEDFHKKFYLKNWWIDEECSLDNGLEYKPQDGNHLYFRKKSLMQIKKLLNIIKINKGKISNRCGLHIHVDLKCFTSSETEEIIENFKAEQYKIMKLFRVNHFRKKWCREINLGATYASLSSNKHNALSTSGFNTLEFRLFNGTLDYNKIMLYIKWVLEFMLRAKNENDS